MTQRTQFALHLFSLGLMIATISIMYWLSYDFAHYTFWTIGCFAFGAYWNKLTNHLIDKHD